MSLEGQQIGRYRIVRLLGSGGMGDVYLAEDARIGQRVAIKVIRTEVSPYPGTEAAKEAARLFEREARAIAKLDHPNILPLFDYGEERVGDVSLVYLVMPYREEGSLMKWLRQRDQAGLLSPQEVANIIRQAADALQHAHNRQIIHQDVKPSNFLMRQREGKATQPDVLLTDFGIATITTGTASASQAVRGTPTYMAPEQCMGHSVPASDQYALAVMAYELLTGRPPFQGGTIQMMYQHMHVQPQPPSTLNPHLSREMDMVLLCALAKQPEQRFAFISAFANAFQQAVQGMQVADAPTLMGAWHPQGPPSPTSLPRATTFQEVEAEARPPQSEAQAWHPQGPPSPTPPPRATTFQETAPAIASDVNEREAWHPQGPPSPTTPPRATTFQETVPTIAGTELDTPIVSAMSAQSTASDVNELEAWHPQGPPSPTPPPRATTFQETAPTIASDVNERMVQSPITPVIASNAALGYVEPPTKYAGPVQTDAMKVETIQGATQDVSSIGPPHATPPPSPLRTDKTLPIELASESLVTLPPGGTSPLTPPPGVLTPVTPLPGGPRRRGGARRWVVLALVLLAVLVVAASGIVFADPGLFGFSTHAPSHPSTAPGTTGVPVAGGTANVTITPAQTDFKQSYLITEVTGTPDPAKHQVQGVRMLSSTQSQSSQATSSGSGQSSSTNATGTLTLSQPSQAVTIPAGTQFVGSSGVAVATDSSVSLSLGSSVQVGAYAVQAGSAGNIPAYDINTTGTYKGINFYVQNPAAFSGGQSGQSYPVLQQSDINAAAQAITGQVTQAAQNGLSSQLQANEHLIGNAQCTSQTSSNYAAGAHVSSATVTVQVTCQQEAYNPRPALTMAAGLLEQDIPKKLGASYAPVGNVLTTATQTTPGNATVSISINAEALAVFQFSDAQLQSLAGQIAGKSQQDAQTLLSQQPGVLKATIILATGSGNTLPTDAKNINIKVEKVQGLQS